MECNVILRFTLTEKLKVNTPGVVDGNIAVEKAKEKIKKKYKGKEIIFTGSNREYDGIF